MQQRTPSQRSKRLTYRWFILSAAEVCHPEPALAVSDLHFDFAIVGAAVHYRPGVALGFRL